MNVLEGTEVERRLLVLAPSEKDGALAGALLAEAGMQCVVCRDAFRLLAEARAGVGALLVAEEALLHGEQDRLAELVARQPRWSDLPILILSEHGAASEHVGELLKTLGNVTVLERPIRVAALVTAVQTALRARERQYQLRAHLLAREREELRRSVELAVTQVLAHAERADEALSDVLQALCETLRRDAGALWTVDEDSRVLRCSGFWHSPQVGTPGFAAATRERSFAPGIGLPGRVWASGEAAWIPELARDANFPRAAAAGQSGLASGFAFPIRLGRRIDGVMEFFRTRAEEPDEDLLAMLTSIGAHIAQFLDRKRSDAALRRSEKNLNDFFENAALGLHLVRHDGTILRANRAELEMLGYSEEEYVGRNIAEFHEDAAVAVDLMERLQSGETLTNYESRMRHKDGSIRDVLIATNALRENGRFVHTRCFTRDVTERKRAERSLHEADRRKDEFLATLAHELRNPLAPISNAVQLVRFKGAVDPDLWWARDVIERQVGHLKRLVDDLLDVSRITRGRLDLREQDVELETVVRDAVDTARPLLEGAGHELTVELPEEPILLRADPLRVAQILSNLLNNAVKYTPERGKIQIVALRRGDEVEIRVRDSGIGIPAEMLPRVFEMFTQLERDRGQGGLGIGLALVQRLVEMHGGSVSAHSAGPDQGSEFVVRLPALPRGSRRASAPQNGSSKAKEEGASQRVLIVDDNRDNAQSLALLLRRLGNDVCTADDGPRALEALTAFQPRIVLLDIGLPLMDGYAVAREVRRRPEGRDVMLVAMTGWGQEEDRRRSREAGFDEHLVKPVDLDVLQKLIESDA